MSFFKNYKEGDYFISLIDNHCLIKIYEIQRKKILYTIVRPIIFYPHLPTVTRVFPIQESVLLTEYKKYNPECPKYLK